VLDYEADQLAEQTPADMEEVFALRDAPTTSWINIDGVHDMEVVRKLGEHFKIHPLTLEDVVNTAQRPKLEEFDDYLFVVLKMLRHDDAGRVHAEQVSLVVGANFLLSFQESEGDVFDAVRDRIRKGQGRIRRSGSAYLAYALIDCVVDHYFLVLEQLSETIETLEGQLYDAIDDGMDLLHEIYRLKQDMIYLRKQIWPLRETLGHLHKTENPLVPEKTKVFFSDVYDHLIQALEIVESLHAVLSGLQDLYLSMSSQRMNEVMKVLTIIATIFIPLSFVAGIYGMNFEVMPELKWRWGYFAVWGLFAAIMGGMLVYFKRRKWL
jgi:magnesium transporter